MFTEIFSNNKIIQLEKTTSTNDYASDIVKTNNSLEGTVIWAQSQTHGKGQKGNVWESESLQNLTFSIILNPVIIKPAAQFILNKAISLGIIDFLKTMIKPSELKIKWPNDIYAGKKKIGGILIENEILGDIYQTAIIGIGLNINQTIFSDGIPNPTSLTLLTGNKYDIQQLLLQLLQYIEYRIIKLYNNDIELINDDYLNNLLYYNTSSKYVYQEQEIEAVITGISEYGELILKQSNNEIIVCSFKEIEFLHH